LKYWL